MHGWDLGNGTCWLKCGLCSQNWGGRMAGAAGSRSVGCRDGITTEQRGRGKGRKQFFSSLGFLNLGKLGFNYPCPKHCRCWWGRCQNSSCWEEYSSGAWKGSLFLKEQKFWLADTVLKQHFFMHKMIFLKWQTGEESTQKKILSNHGFKSSVKKIKEGSWKLITLQHMKERGIFWY